jgi:hypothetical protein
MTFISLELTLSCSELSSVLLIVMHQSFCSLRGHCYAITITVASLHRSHGFTWYIIYLLPNVDPHNLLLHFLYFTLLN